MTKLLPLVLLMASSIAASEPFEPPRMQIMARWENALGLNNNLTILKVDDAEYLIVQTGHGVVVTPLPMATPPNELGPGWRRLDILPLPQRYEEEINLDSMLFTPDPDSLHIHPTLIDNLCGDGVWHGRLWRLP